MPRTGEEAQEIRSPTEKLAAAKKALATASTTHVRPLRESTVERILRQANNHLLTEPATHESAEMPVDALGLPESASIIYSRALGEIGKNPAYATKALGAISQALNRIGLAGNSHDARRTRTHAGRDSQITWYHAGATNYHKQEIQRELMNSAIEIARANNGLLGRAVQVAGVHYPNLVGINALGLAHQLVLDAANVPGHEAAVLKFIANRFTGSEEQGRLRIALRALKTREGFSTAVALTEQAMNAGVKTRPKLLVELRKELRGK